MFCVWAEVCGLGTGGDQPAERRLDALERPRRDYASWLKWPVIVASVSSMFAVMINSTNGIARILNTMAPRGPAAEDARARSTRGI